MERVVCVPAKVPIVKIWDPEYKLAADLNVNNPAALENTRLIKVYVDIDERVRPLAMVIKFWTKQRILNDAGKTNLGFQTLANRCRNRRDNQFICLDLSDIKLLADSETAHTAIATSACQEQE
jgi:hypothetical protein